MTCPNCGNYYNANDPDNEVRIEAGARQPIEAVEYIQQEMNEAVIKYRCYACSSVWTGRYSQGKLMEVERWHQVNGIQNHKI